MNALPFGYRPLGWNADLTAQDYLAHMQAEFDRLSIDPHKDLLQFTYVWRSLRYIDREVLGSIPHYIDCAIEESHTEKGLNSTPSDFGIRIGFRVNQIGNLTMTWDPDEKTIERFGIFVDHSLPVGWSRPRNELVYIKEMDFLRFPVDEELLRGTTRLPTSTECLASDLLCCARKRIEKVIDEVQRTVHVTVASAFKFTLEDKPMWMSSAPTKNLVVDWKIEQL